VVHKVKEKHESGGKPDTSETIRETTVKQENSAAANFSESRIADIITTRYFCELRNQTSIKL
jgi:hypothetical protein